MISRKSKKNNYVPFYEHLVDGPIMEAILGRKKPSITSEKASKIRFMEFYRDFFVKTGFDCLPFETGLHLFHLGGQQAGSRGWVDHSVATINNMEEFEEYPWPDIDQVFDFELIEAAKSVLPDKMKMVCGVAGGVQEHVLNLLGLKRFSIAVRNDRDFIAKMFEKVGFLIWEVDRRIVEYEWVGALRMGADYVPIENYKQMLEYGLKYGRSM